MGRGRKGILSQSTKKLNPIRHKEIAKRTKSKNRMQITEFLARLGQHERVLREIQEI